MLERNYNIYHISGQISLTILNQILSFYRRKPEDMTILMGTNDLTVGGERYQVEIFFKHSGYHRPASDIALIRIEDTIEFNSFIQPIEYSMEEIQPNSILQFSMLTVNVCCMLIDYCSLYVFRFFSWMGWTRID